MKTRIFVIGPSNFDSHMGDPTPRYWVVCKTDKSGSLTDIYGADDYEEVSPYICSKSKAITYAKKLGAKRVVMI